MHAKNGTAKAWKDRERETESREEEGDLEASFETLDIAEPEINFTLRLLRLLNYYANH